MSFEFDYAYRQTTRKLRTLFERIVILMGERHSRHPCVFGTKKLRTRKGLSGSSSIRAIGGVLDRSDDSIVMIIKESQRCRNLFGAKIGMSSRTLNSSEVHP